jgi:hypothetical protein
MATDLYQKRFKLTELSVKFGTNLISFDSLHILPGREAMFQHTTKSFHSGIQHFYVICHGNKTKKCRGTTDTTHQLRHRPGDERPYTWKEDDNAGVLQVSDTFV